MNNKLERPSLLHTHQPSIEVDHTIEEVEPLSSDTANTQVTSQTMRRGWSGNTGPKGVLIDFKASHGKSGAILGGHALNAPSPSLASPRARIFNPSTSRDSDASDHMVQRNSSSDSISTSRSDHDLYGSTNTTSRLTQIPPIKSALFSTNFNLDKKNLKVDPRGIKLFGHLREVGAENFIQSIEADKDNNQTTVLVHLYDPAIESCVVLNTHLSNLARAYPRTKFLRALASELDFFSTSGFIKGGKVTIPTTRSNGVINLMDHDPFDEQDSRNNALLEPDATDSDILPTLIWYRSGQYVRSLPALESQMPESGIMKGEKGCKDLEVLLKRNGVISTC